MDDPEPDDFALLRAWRTGDERAGKQLFDRHFDAVYRFLRTKIGDAADDLCQQTFLGCLESKERFRGDATFRTFLFRIAKNRLYSHLRDSQRARARFEPDKSSVFELGAASPSSFVAARDEHRILLEAMRRLPVDLQVSLELHDWEGLTVAEIAEVVEAPEGTIKRRLQRAREKLDELIVIVGAKESTVARDLTAEFERWAESLRAALDE